VGDFGTSPSFSRIRKGEIVCPIIRTSYGENRNLEDDAYGVSTVTVGKFNDTKLLQFRLKGNTVKIMGVSRCFGVASTRIITTESTHLEVRILGILLRLDEEHGE